MSKDYYFIERNTPNNESIIVEYGFLDSKGDDVTQLKNNWETLAEGVVKAITNYIGIPYIQTNTEDYYIVKPGDTLWSIAKNNNISVNEIKRINKLTSNTISVGQRLLLKETSVTDNDVYTVKSGDTLYKIANEFNTNVDKLKNTNNLKSNILTIGQKLIIPKNTNSNIPIDEENTYTVKSGDTLYKISNEYNINIDDLKKQNNLISDVLSIGQVLTIPKKQVYTTYTVINGDTLYQIARKYNTTVTNITEINNLTTTNLRVGQKLLVPN